MTIQEQNAPVHARSIHRDALREAECWLTAEFQRSPSLPVIERSHDQHFVLDQVYRAMLDYLFHWVITTQSYHLRPAELRVMLFKIAARYGHVKEVSPTELR